MAAIPWNALQAVVVAHSSHRASQGDAQYFGGVCAPNTSSLLSLQEMKLAWTGKPAMLQVVFEKHCSSTGNRARVFCNAAVSSGGVSSLEKIDFKRLQNGSDIRGVAVAGVEGEPVNLTEAATEAIGAAFAGWLLDKKKADGSRRLRVSVGHDSRISADSLQECLKLLPWEMQLHIHPNMYVGMVQIKIQLTLSFCHPYLDQSGKLLQVAVARGIAGAGLDVILYGLASTPAMFNSTLTEDEEFLCPVDGSIMVTASHLPYNRNGLKFFTNAGGLGKSDITEILARAAKIYDSFSEDLLIASKQAAAESSRRVDYMKVYTSDLVKAVRKAAGSIDRPLEGFDIIVDAGNGAGGFFAGSVLEPLGAVTTGSQFLEPDGMFPNHIPNPEDKVAMAAINKAVLEHKADLGIIFDTDVDRSAAVDSTGREFNRNRLIALMSAIVLEEHPRTTIVTDSVTSDGLTTFIENKLGGKHHRFKRGYKNVIDEAIRLNSIGQESHLAIETSGHGALKENHWLDDGAYLMVKLLNKLAAAKAAGEGLGSSVLTKLIAGLEEADVAVELRLKIDQNHANVVGRSFRDYGEAVLKHLENASESDPSLQKAPVNHEGVRVSGHGGWFLLRLSLHDPVLPLNIEAPTKEAASKLALAVFSAVKDFTALDISPLQKFIDSSV